MCFVRSHAGPWSKVILEFSAFEQGVQYDRVGAVWIGDIEVVRTTTPEPTANGITWSFETDVTIYSEYFRSSGENLFTSLSIPNNVDATYTGVINVNVFMIFYVADEPSNVVTDVIPLTKAPSDGESAFLNI